MLGAFSVFMKYAKLWRLGRTGAECRPPLNPGAPGAGGQDQEPDGAAPAARR